MSKTIRQEKKRRQSYAIELRWINHLCDYRPYREEDRRNLVGILKATTQSRREAIRHEDSEEKNRGRSH